MEKQKFDPSGFMYLEKFEELKKLGNTPDLEEFSQAVMDIFKTPLILRTLARAIEKDEKRIIKGMAREVQSRMAQILNDPNLPDS